MPKAQNKTAEHFCFTHNATLYLVSIISKAFFYIYKVSKKFLDVFELLNICN